MRAATQPQRKILYPRLVARDAVPQLEIPVETVGDTSLLVASSAPVEPVVDECGVDAGSLVGIAADRPQEGWNRRSVGDESVGNGVRSSAVFDAPASFEPMMLAVARQEDELRHVAPIASCTPGPSCSIVRDNSKKQIRATIASVIQDSSSCRFCRLPVESWQPTVTDIARPIASSDCRTVFASERSRWMFFAISLFTSNVPFSMCQICGPNRIRFQPSTSP